jgi:hypothetical protein
MSDKNEQLMKCVVARANAETEFNDAVRAWKLLNFPNVSEKTIKEKWDDLMAAHVKLQEAKRAILDLDLSSADGTLINIIF